MDILVWCLVTFVFISDQLSKFLVSRMLDHNESIEIIKNIFRLTLVHNTGVAFGVFPNQTFVFTGVSLLAVIAIVAYLRKKTDTYLREIALALILGGALGNLVDRLRFGYVIDFLDFRIWPVFNVADSAITVGALLLILSFFRKTLNTKHKIQN